MNRQEIDQWIDEMDHFEFSKLIEIEEDPLSITLGYMHENEVWKYNRVKINPIGILKWDYKKSKRFKPSESTDLRQVALDLDCNQHIKLKFIHSFKEIELECNQIEIQYLSPIDIKPKLKFNETWVSLSVPPQDSIKPTFWIEELAIRNLECSFRMYGGDPKEPNHVPDDYTGYCLSKIERITENPTGIFISSSKSNSESMFIILECQDELSYDLWINMIDIFCEIKDCIISIGDVSFNQKIWKTTFKNQFEKNELKI